MKLNLTKSCRKAIVLLSLCAMGNMTSTAQTKVFATYESKSGSTTNHALSGDGNLSTYATLEASAALLGFIGKTGSVTVTYPAAIPAGKTMYIGVSQTGDNTLLQSLLGGTLGDLLNGVLGVLALGVPTITVDFYNISTVIPTHSISLTPGSSDNIEYGADGRMYLKIDVPETFKSVKIKLSNPSILPLGALIEDIYLNVHDVFYFDGPATPCSEWNVTKYDVTGLTLEVLQNNPVPIENPSNAIDGDITTFSTLGYSPLLGLDVASTLSQTVVFASPSVSGEQPVLVFKRDGTLLTLDLLNNINIKVQNGSTTVFDGSAASLLSLDLLNILSLKLGTTLPVRVNVPVTSTFDRVTISYSQLVEVGVLQNPLKVFEINKAPKVPELVSYDITNCDGLDYSLNIVDPTSTITYEWFDKDLSPIGSGSSFLYTFPEDGDTDTIFVWAKSACGTTSNYRPVFLTGSRAMCLDSEVDGNVVLASYFTTNPLNAVLTNAEDKVKYMDNVNIATGEYDFGNVARGSYKLYLINEDVAINDIITNSKVDEGYEITPAISIVNVIGYGDPIALPSHEIIFTPLSTIWKSVQATLIGTDARIEWEVLENNAINYFEIYKSVDGKVFNQIKSIHGMLQNSKYEYIDNHFENTAYYKVIAYNGNEKIAESNVVKLERNASNTPYLFPTLVQNQLVLKGLNGGELIYVVSQSGQIITTIISAKNTENINVSHLASGQYVIKIMSNNNQTILRFVKN